MASTQYPANNEVIQTGAQLPGGTQPVVAMAPFQNLAGRMSDMFCLRYALDYQTLRVYLFSILIE